MGSGWARRARRPLGCACHQLSGERSPMVGLGGVWLSGTPGGHRAVREESGATRALQRLVRRRPFPGVPGRVPAAVAATPSGRPACPAVGTNGRGHLPPTRGPSYPCGLTHHLGDVWGEGSCPPHAAGRQGFWVHRLLVHLRCAAATDLEPRQRVIGKPRAAMPTLPRPKPRCCQTPEQRQVLNERMFAELSTIRWDREWSEVRGTWKQVIPRHFVAKYRRHMSHFRAYLRERMEQ